MRFFCLIVLIASYTSTIGQSLEIMIGDDRVFADMQWLKYFDDHYTWSLFSRTRATVDYDNNTSFFSGAYLNYTTKSGLGASLVGKLADAGAGADAGIHFLKGSSNFTFFGLASVGLKSTLEYSWFSIIRYTPSITEGWKLYTSLELFTLFGRGDHLISVQRARLGLDYKSFQFGLAGNFTEIGMDWTSSANIGGFIRKSF